MKNMITKIVFIFYDKTRFFCTAYIFTLFSSSSSFLPIDASCTCLINLFYTFIVNCQWNKYIQKHSRCTVILTGWLFSPDSDWHQYTPVSDEIVELIVHVDPVCDPHSEDEQSSSCSLSVYLLTLHLSELLWSSQLRERETYVKCWVLLGLMIRETGGETPEKTIRVKHLEMFFSFQ